MSARSGIGAANSSPATSERAQATTTERWPSATSAASNSPRIFSAPPTPQGPTGANGNAILKTVSDTGSPLYFVAIAVAHFLFRLAGEFTESCRVHAPGKAVVQDRRLVWGSREVIFGCDAVALVRRGKAAQRLTLRLEAGNQGMLARKLFRRELVHHLVRLLRAAEEHARAAVPRVIKRRLDDGGSALGVVHGERTGVMVGVAALVGVRKDHLRPMLLNQASDAPGQFRETQTRLLIRNIEALVAGAADPGALQRGLKLICPALAIIVKAVESVGAAVVFVARGAIRDVNK